MRTTRVAVVFCTAITLVVPGTARGQAVPPPRDSPDLKSLYERHEWVALYDALKHSKGSALYRGAADVTFNHDVRKAEKHLTSVIKTSPHSDDAYEASEWLMHLYFREGRYRDVMSVMDERWASFPGKSERQQEQSALAGFRGLPNQASGKPRHSTLPHEPGSTFVPISVNGHTATYFFDTGAWVSCMSASEAQRLGLTVQETAGTLGTGTGARVGFRTAVAKDVTIGGIHFRDVSFAVFSDDQEPWSVLPPGRRGLIGIPILLGLGTLRWSNEGSLDVGLHENPLNVPAANLRFDNDHLVITADVEQRSVMATLDTGAETTDLYQAFADTFPALLAASGKKDSTEVRGVGNAESFESVTLPEVHFHIGGVDTALRPAHVLLRPIGARCCVGNVGMDLLKQAPAFRIDFTAMTLQLESEK